MHKKELLKKIKQNVLLSIDEQLSIFDLPNKDIKEILLEYMSYDYLCRDAQLKIFNLPTEMAKEIWDKYSCVSHYISLDAIEKAHELGWM